MTKENIQRKKDILRMRANRYKLKDIAKKYGITTGRVWQIIENHICRFNDYPQRCECYIAGIKEILEGLVEREEKNKSNQSVWGQGWNEAKQDTVSYLQSLIKEL